MQGKGVMETYWLLGHIGSEASQNYQDNNERNTFHSKNLTNVNYKQSETGSLNENTKQLASTTETPPINNNSDRGMYEHMYGIST